MKMFYSDYVRHCRECYINHTYEELTDDIDKRNWMACDKSLAKTDSKEKSILLFVYRVLVNERCGMREAIDRVLFGTDYKRNYIWKVINQFEKRVATKCSL